MKALLKRNGMLEVTPETEVEAYALDRWSKENFEEGVSSNILILHSELFELPLVTGQDGE